MRKKWLLISLVLVAILSTVEVALADPSITGDATIFEQHQAFTGAFDTNTFSITSGKTYILVLSAAVWTTTDTVTITTPAGSVLTWATKIPVDSSVTVGDTAIYVATAGSSNASEKIHVAENGVGFFHYSDVKVYEMTGYNGTGATASATSAVGGGPAPTVSFTPSSTGSYLLESASTDAHALSNQAEWTLLYSTSTDAFIFDGRMTALTTSTATRTVAPAISGGSNGFSIEVLEFLGTAATTATPTPFAKGIIIYE